MDISFTVYGVPIAQPRTRAMGRLGRDGKPFAHVYEPGNKHSPARQWKSDIRWTVKQQMENKNKALIGGPVQLLATFYMPRTKELSKDKYPAGVMPHVVKPDLENMVKLLQDALTGVMIIDDKQIFVVTASKYYHAKKEGPRVEVTIRD